MIVHLGTYVASDLAEFLTYATEGMALSQAIEARGVARTQAEAEHTEAPTRIRSVPTSSLDRTSVREGAAVTVRGAG